MKLPVRDWVNVVGLLIGFGTLTLLGCQNYAAFKDGQAQVEKSLARIEANLGSEIKRVDTLEVRLDSLTGAHMNQSRGEPDGR